jgi:hypothetical protein
VYSSSNMFMYYPSSCLLVEVEVEITLRLAVSMSWYRAPLWDLQPDIISYRNVAVWNLRSCIYWAPSLTRGRVCSVITQWSESLRTRNHALLSHLRLSQLDSTLHVCPYLTGNTLRLRYELNRLMLSICLWRWHITITITILDISHCPVFYLK